MKSVGILPWRRKLESKAKEKIIDGELFERIVIAGAYNLKAHIDLVNELNVFPIPDGDTGDNMFMTINGGLSGLKNVKENSVCLKAKALADGMLLNARGNSGVILSQLFSGLANGLTDLETVDIKRFGEALSLGVKQAYSAVLKPVEGTMLTVAREAAEYGIAHNDVTLGVFFDGFVKEMKASLDNTPNLLATLKEAGVIDSGGAGLLYITEGMRKAVDGKEIDELAVTEVENQTSKDLDFSLFTEDSQMQFGYCTEFLLRLQNSKVNAKDFDISPIVDFLNTVGDSIVAFKTGTIVKVHVHTMTPAKVMDFCQQFGEFLTIKIENMTLQHNESTEKTENKHKPKKVKRTKFGVVTVATGKGLVDTFTEFGADVVIDGGQGKNPSIERFIEAFDDANADHIFVLPNNSNIIMAAKQAASIYNKSCIHVVETKNFGQAYSILSMLDYSADDPDVIKENMLLDMANVTTGMITSSIRNANIDGVDIEKGQYIGFTDKVMQVSANDKVTAFIELAKNLDADSKEFMIAVYGKDVNEHEKQEVRNLVSNNYSNLEFYEIDGEQDVYDFIMILE